MEGKNQSFNMFKSLRQFFLIKAKVFLQLSETKKTMDVHKFLQTQKNSFENFV